VTKVYESPFTDFSPKLFHQYNAVSTANAKSQFRPLNRVVEFDYNILERDSLVEVMMMLTSGFNEGEILDHLITHLQNEESIKVNFETQESREYVETYSHNYTQPVNRTQTVTDFGGTDVVTKADGTVEHVQRPMTTKTVNTTEQVAHNSQGGKSQLFNSAKMQLKKDDIASIKINGVDSFEVSLQNSSLILAPSKYQVLEMKSYLMQ
jgi:hypothetical protein